MCCTCVCVCRHVVLGVAHGGSYGALGLSRRRDLMYKPLEFKVNPQVYVQLKVLGHRN